jgi:mannose/fructose/N-acetylgalactosamine-specific phosphotransferase system component IID
MTGQLSTLFRSFAVQAAFNYDRMSGLGLSFIMRPLLRNLPEEKREAAGERSAEYFNCHPFLSGLAATALVRAEMSGHSADEIDRFKRALIGPLGLIGDRFIWAGLLPSISGAALVLMSRGGGLFGPVFLVLVFSSVSLAIRWAGIKLGDRKGVDVGRTLAHPGVRKTLAVVDAFAAFMIGLAVPQVCWWLAGAWPIADIGGLLVVAALGVTISRGVFGRVDSLRFGLVAIGLTLVIGSFL